MPSSFPDALAIVLPFVAALRPRSVLDVGIGFGKYGFLFREYLDVAGREDEAAPAAFARRTVRIDGVEGCPAYVTNLQHAIYDTIHVGDARDVLRGLGPYDLVFASDVLEHFTRDDGRAFLDASRRLARLGVLIVTPAIDIEQDAAFGNPLEIHKSFWTVADFASRPGADVLVWRRQLVAWLPVDGVTRRLPRPSARDALGLLARACLAGVVGPLRSEQWLARWRQRAR